MRSGAPYCGAEQTPPDETTPPAGWQDENIPVGDWDDEADPPPDNTWVDDPPVPGWEDDTPYEPAPEDQDAPRSKALLIAIFAALGVALIVLLIALNVKPKPKAPAAAVTPVVTATAQPSAAPTPSAARRRRRPRQSRPTAAISCRTAPRAGSRRQMWRASHGSSAASRATRSTRATAASSRQKQIAAYFEAQSWYHGTVPGASFDNNTLSPIEHANADFLANYETATWGHSYY